MNGKLTVQRPECQEVSPDENNEWDDEHEDACESSVHLLLPICRVEIMSDALEEGLLEGTFFQMENHGLQPKLAVSSIQKNA